MANRRTSQEVIEEFHRLYDCFEVISECMFGDGGIPGMESALENTIPRARMLQFVDEKKVTASEIVSGTREALNDTTEELLILQEDNPEDVKRILANYRKRTGRDYWQDAGHPKKMINAILKRGTIADETEFRLVNAYLGNLDQTVMTPKQVEKANEILAHFEENYSGEG